MLSFGSKIISSLKIAHVETVVDHLMPLGLGQPRKISKDIIKVLHTLVIACILTAKIFIIGSPLRAETQSLMLFGLATDISIVDEATLFLAMP